MSSRAMASAAATAGARSGLSREGPSARSQVIANGKALGARWPRIVGIAGMARSLAIWDWMGS